MPGEIFRRAKAEAAMDGVTLSAFMMDAVVNKLEHGTKIRTPRRQVKLPLVRSRRPGKLHITGDAVARALAAEDLHALA